MLLKITFMLQPSLTLCSCWTPSSTMLRAACCWENWAALSHQKSRPAAAILVLSRRCYVFISVLLSKRSGVVLLLPCRCSVEEETVEVVESGISLQERAREIVESREVKCCDQLQVFEVHSGKWSTRLLWVYAVWWRTDHGSWAIQRRVAGLGGSVWYSSVARKKYLWWSCTVAVVALEILLPFLDHLELWSAGLHAASHKGLWVKKLRAHVFEHQSGGYT